MALHLLTALANDNPNLHFTAICSQITTLIFWCSSAEDFFLAECRSQAKQILSRISNASAVNQLKWVSLMIRDLLEQVIRPAFIRSRSRNITAAGRKAISPLEQALTSSEDDKLLKPWKFSQKYVVYVLVWVIESSNVWKSLFFSVETH